MGKVEHLFFDLDAPPPAEHSHKPLAVITGAAGGIGAALAHRMAERGYRTVLIDVKSQVLHAMAGRFSRHAYSLPVVLDLSDRDEIEQTMLPLLRTHGPVDVLINCAGVGIYRQFLDHRRGDHEKLMRVNYLSAVEMIRLVLPGMLRTGKGHVINVASMSSKIGPWGHAAYAASKAALVSLTQTLAAEYQTKKLHFSYVNPGVVDTPYYNSAETAELWSVVSRHAIHADDVAERMVRLLDRPRLELCVPSHYKLIDLLKSVSVRLTHWVVKHSSRPRKSARGPVVVVPNIPGAHRAAS